MKVQMLILTSAIIAVSTGCNNSAPTSTDSNDTVINESKQITTVNTVKTVEVEPKIKTKFTEKYPTAQNVEWTRYETEPTYIDWELTGWPSLDTTDYAAKYNVDNTEYWSWYTPEGEWIGTVSTINNTDLPSEVNQTLQSQFAGYTVTSINKENDKNRTAYEIKMEKGTDKMKALIDEKGNVMKKKGIENGEKVKEKNL